jgi:MFS family permease
MPDTVTAVPVPAPRVDHARWAVAITFGAAGLVIGSLAVRTPSLKADLGLTDGQLGLVSALIGSAAVVAMQVAGRLAARLGSAPLVRVAAVAQPAALLWVGVAPSAGQLAAAVVLLGAAIGTLDVGMNAHAVAVERALRRPVLNGCHAGWSIGAVAGSLLGGAEAGAGISRAVHYLCLTPPLAVAMLAAGRLLLPAASDRRTDPAHPAHPAHPAGPGHRPGRRGRPGWTRRLLLLGGMGALVLTGEAAVANWSGVLLQEHQGASLGVAAAGYVAFTVCQTALRLVGDRLSARHAAASLVRAGTAAAAAGLAVAVASPWPALAVGGFAVAGIGLATPLPTLFSVVGHLGARDGAGAAVFVARFTTMTYAGILFAPALIGWCAAAVGLAWTVAGLVPLLLAVAARAGAAIPPGTGPAGAGSPAHPADLAPACP